MTGAVYLVSAVLIMQVLQCSIAEPRPSSSQAKLNTTDKFSCKPEVLDDPSSLAQVLMVLQNFNALKCVSHNHKAVKQAPDSWTLYNLFIGPDRSNLDPDPWAQHCSFKSNSLDKFSPEDYELYHNIWPDIFSDGGEESNKMEIQKNWLEEGCCGMKYAQYKEHPPFVMDPNNPEETVPHVTHCTIKGKFHPANCYYQQAKGLFENGIKNKDLLPAHHILNDSHATTPPDPVEENASQFLDTILKNLFGQYPYNINGPLQLHKVQEAFFDVTGDNANPYLGCQKNENGACFLTRVGLCFQCSVDRHTKNNPPYYHGCCTPSPYDPTNARYYSPGNLANCTELSVYSGKIPWNRQGSHTDDVSCYSSECSQIRYIPPEDTNTKC